MKYIRYEQTNQTLTIFLTCESTTDLQTHVVESAEVFGQCIVQFAFQSCQDSELVPYELTGLTVTLDTKR